MSNQPSWLQLAKHFQNIPSSGEPLRAEWFAYDGSEDYGIWLLRPGGPPTDEVRGAFSLLAARAIAKLGIASLPTPQAQQHFPDWGRVISYIQSRAPRAGRTIDLSNAVPYGLGGADQDAVDPYTRAWLEWLRRHSLAFRSVAGELSMGDRVYPSRSGLIEDLCLASAVACSRLAREEVADRPKQRLRRARGVEDTRQRAQRRQAVVHPMLAEKRWTRGRLVTESGVGKATVYGYLDGTRASINHDNRRAIAEALGLKTDQLPL